MPRKTASTTSVIIGHRIKAMSQSTSIPKTIKQSGR